MGLDKKLSQGIDERFNLRSFISDASTFSAGQFLLLFFGFVQIFIIPKYLTVEDYGYWKIFLLYGTYVGMAHLGFIDGILIRWAGKKITKVGSEIKLALKFLFLEQIIIIIPLAFLLHFLLDPSLTWISWALLGYAIIFNLTSFFRFTAQAVKRFKIVTVINISRQAIFLLIIIIMIIYLGYFEYYYAIFAMLTSYLIALVIFSFSFRKYLFKSRNSRFSLWDYGKENISIGSFVLMGNLIVILFFTIDRLMVSSFFSIKQFAIYGFSLTVATTVYIFVRAVSQVFFPYLSGLKAQLRTKTYRLAKPFLIISWAAILSTYFPLTQLIRSYLPQYAPSLVIIPVLLCTGGFGSIIQVLHVNYFKTYHKQRQYFLCGITAFVLAATLNIVAIRFWGTLESVALATLISFSGWYTLNELILKSISGQNNMNIFKGLAVICSYLSVFLLVPLISDSIIYQMLIYIIFFLFITWIALGPEVKELTKIAKNLRRKTVIKSEGKR